jgi:hypothetical protein
VTPAVEATMLDAWPLWAVGVVLIVIFFVASEIGFIGFGLFKRRQQKNDASDEVQVLSTALVLLALLLGFTFSMALNRYESRRIQVVQEANDIGTAWLRASLFDNDAARALQARLKDYARTRVARADDGDNEGAYVDLKLEGGKLRTEIWALTAAATAPERTTPQAASLVAAVNAVLDTATRREAEIEERIPAQVLGLLLVYSTVSAALLGYVFGAYGAPHRITGLVLFTLLALTITLILDLDRAQGGGVRVDQQAIVDLIAGMTPPAAMPATGPVPPS